MSRKKRSIWKIMGLALAATPMVFFIGLVVITLIGALDDAITKIQLAGYWWIMLIIVYILSLLYFIFVWKLYRISVEREYEGRKELERKIREKYAKEFMKAQVNEIFKDGKKNERKN